ncbi:MAG: hypothetical protein RKH07_02975 [Gammaproteobacteria bacterium]
MAMGPPGFEKGRKEKDAVFQRRQAVKQDRFKRYQRWLEARKSTHAGRKDLELKVQEIFAKRYPGKEMTYKIRVQIYQSIYVVETRQQL